MNADESTRATTLGASRGDSAVARDDGGVLEIDGNRRESRES